MEYFYKKVILVYISTAKKSSVEEELHKYIRVSKNYKRLKGINMTSLGLYGFQILKAK